MSPPAPARARRGPRAVSAAWLGALIALVLVAGAAVGRLSLELRAEWTAVRAAQRAGDVELELIHLGRAARWATGGLGLERAARAELLALARRLDDRADPGALAAYSELRAATLAIRTPWSLDSATLAVADEAIARLLAARARAEGWDELEPALGEPGFYAEALAELPGPRRPWLAWLAGLGFGAWVAAIGALALGGLGPEGRLAHPSALGRVIAVALTSVSWPLALLWS